MVGSYNVSSFVCYSRCGVRGSARPSRHRSDKSRLGDAQGMGAETGAGRRTVHPEKTQQMSPKNALN